MMQLQNMGIRPLFMSQSMPFVPDRDLFISTTKCGPQGPQGSQGPQGPTGSPGLVPVTNVSTTPFDILAADYFLGVNIPIASSVVLPIGVPVGTVYIVKDTSGLAFTNPITVTALTSTIDGGTSYTLNTNYGSITLIRSSLEWSVL